MLKDMHFYGRIIVPITLAALLLFAFAPGAFATPHISNQSDCIFVSSSITWRWVIRLHLVISPMATSIMDT
jgi:hypothetical protein